MSRFTAFIFTLILLGLCRLSAQQPPAAPPAGTIVTPVAPPMPGQLKAEPAATPSRIPDTSEPTNSVVPSTALNKNKTASSTSSSGQFIVHGNDLSLRSAFSSRCEEISTELRDLLHDREAWALPIVVLLNSGEAAKLSDKAAKMEVSQITHGGFHIQVTVNLRPDLRPTDVRAEIIRALLAERILRDQKELTSKRAMLLPDWLYTGIMEALDYRKRTRPSALFAAIFKSGKIFGIEEIIEASPVEMDGLSKTIYQTSCCALVLALLDQPEGGARLNKFLSSLSSDARPERDLLNLAYPSFATTSASLNKWWSLQLASLSRPSVAEPLSAADTMKMLEEALTLRYQAKPSEIPKPRPVIAMIPPQPAAEPNPRPKAESKTSEPAEINTAEVEPTEEKKRSLFSRLNPFGRKKASHEEVIAAAIEKAAEEEAKAADEKEQAKAAEETKLADGLAASGEKRMSSPNERKPLFNRWFGEDAKPSPSKTVRESDNAKAEEAAPAEEIQDVKKPSLFNPLNWFRKNRSKDDSSPVVPSEEPTDLPSSKETTPKPQTTTAIFGDWIKGDVPLVAFAYQESATEEPVKEKKRFMGLFGGKKKPEEKPAEAEPPKEEKKKEEKPKEQPKEEPKVEKPESKPEVKESKTEQKEAPKPEAEPASTMPAEAAPTAGKSKREPIRIRPLFGSGKKKEEEVKAEPEMAPKPEPELKPATDEKPVKPAKESPPQEKKPAAAKSEPEKKAMPEVKPSAPRVEPPEPKKEEAPKAIIPKESKPKPATTPKEEPLAAAAVPIDDYAAIMKRKDRKEILQRNLSALTALQQRCAVLFRPIVADYTALVIELIDGKEKNVEARLQKLRQQGQQALVQSKAVRDLLDLSEANSSPAMSGLFESYIKLPETIQKELPERKDPISKYLDALDREFSKQ